MQLPSLSSEAVGKMNLLSDILYDEDKRLVAVLLLLLLQEKADGKLIAALLLILLT